MRSIARIFGISCAAAPVLYGIGCWIERIADPDVPPGLFVVLTFLLPLAAFAIPCAMLAWLGIAATRRWRSHVPIVFGVSVAMSGLLFGAGRWTRGSYGLDPPYALFFLGWAMQLVALLAPVATLIWLGVGAFPAPRRSGKRATLDEPRRR